jgi:hypothetical protein
MSNFEGRKGYMGIDDFVELAKKIAVDLLRQDGQSLTEKNVNRVATKILSGFIEYIEEEGTKEELDQDKIEEISKRIYLSEMLERNDREGNNIVEMIGDYLHVIPIEETEHLPSPECWCNPKITGRGAGMLVVHCRKK